MAIFSIGLAIMSLMMFYVTTAQPYDGQMGRYHAYYPPIDLHLIFEKLDELYSLSGIFYNVKNDRHLLLQKVSQSISLAF